MNDFNDYEKIKKTYKRKHLPDISEEDREKAIEEFLKVKGITKVDYIEKESSKILVTKENKIDLLLETDIDL